MYRTRRTGFTLIEVLIVVVIMAVLAGTIIPQFAASTKDAKDSAFRFNLHALRSQIELYKIHHNSTPPTGANNLEQLIKATDISGATGIPGPSYPFGPYVQSSMPTNPFTNSNKVTLDTAASGTPTPTGTSAAGWIYRASTGEIWADHPDYIGL